MKILTWNLYLELYNIENRITKIVDLIDDIDIICFQEVRDKILYLLIQLMNNKKY